MLELLPSHAAELGLLEWCALPRLLSTVKLNVPAFSLRKMVFRPSHANQLVYIHSGNQLNRNNLERLIFRRWRCLYSGKFERFEQLNEPLSYCSLCPLHGFMFGLRNHLLPHEMLQKTTQRSVGTEKHMTAKHLCITMNTWDARLRTFWSEGGSLNDLLPEKFTNSCHSFISLINVLRKEQMWPRTLHCRRGYWFF